MCRFLLTLTRLIIVSVTLLAALQTVTTSDDFQGCQIRYGRKGGFIRVYEGVLVLCDGAGTEPSLPLNVPSDTVYMALVNFNFSRLLRANFTRIQELQYLMIKDSGVDAIAADAFADLQQLNELELHGTRVAGADLRFITEKHFRARALRVTGSPRVTRLDFAPTAHLSRITDLDLSRNALHEFDEEHLRRMTSLQTLILSGNRLRTLAWRHLAALKKLNELAIDGNRIQTIANTSLPVFRAVRTLRIGANPYHCNCRLRWLKEFLDASIDRNSEREAASCASPFRAHFATSGAPKRFRCGRPSAPLMTWQRLPGAEYTYLVNCSSRADPTPRVEMVLPGGRRLVAPPGANLAQLEGATPRVVSGGGEVICQAINAEGVSEERLELPTPSGSVRVYPNVVLFFTAFFLIVC